VSSEIAKQLTSFPPHAQYQKYRTKSKLHCNNKNLKIAARKIAVSTLDRPNCHLLSSSEPVIRFTAINAEDHDLSSQGQKLASLPERRTRSKR
jgi:hypothetical protein